MARRHWRFPVWAPASGVRVGVDLSPLDVVDTRSRALLTATPLPTDVTPMLPMEASQPFTARGWLFEPKFGGRRCVAVIDGPTVKLHVFDGGGGQDRYPQVCEALESAARYPVAVDGQLVDDSMWGVVYQLFDLIHVDGWDTTQLPLRLRKAVMGHSLTFSGLLRFTVHHDGDWREAIQEACDQGWSGVVGKKTTGRYVAGASPTWRTLECGSGQGWATEMPA